MRSIKKDNIIDLENHSDGFFKLKTLLLSLSVVLLSVGLAYMCVAPPTELPNWPLYRANSKVWQTLEKWSKTAKPHHLRLVEMATQFLESRTLYLVTYLGVPDILESTSEPLGCEDLKPRLEEYTVGEPIDLPFFCRLLHAAAHFDILEEVGEKRYRLTEMSRYLVSTHPKSLKHYIQMMAGDEAFVIATSLTRSVFTGNSGFKETYRVEMLEQFKKDPVFQEIFDRGQGDASRLYAPALIADYPLFASCKHICDIGGGVGSFLYQLLDHYNFVMTGVLFDLPDVTHHARKFLGEMKVKVDDIAVIEGDFFEGIPSNTSCDCFLLKDILNNWSDEACVKLLNNLHLAMRQGDKIIVMERVMHTADFAEERFKAILDLTMMTFNPAHSRLRTEEELYYLLEQTGFIEGRTYSTRAGYSIIEAFPMNQ